jgi:hypothetical protein
MTTTHHKESKTMNRILSFAHAVSLNEHRQSVVHAARAVTLSLAAAALSACGGGHSNAEAVSAHAVAADITQDSACQVSSWRVAEGCTPGQKIVFLPESWGNEQMPVMFAALNCDLRYQVVSSKGAVACIFRPVKPEAAKPVAAASAPASPPADSGASR